MPYVSSPEPYLAFDLGGWHASCPDDQVHLIMSDASGVPWLYCSLCRCTAQIDLVADHITPASSKEARVAA